MGAVEVGARKPHRAVDALVVDRHVKRGGALPRRELGRAVVDLAEIVTGFGTLVGDAVIDRLGPGGIGALDRYSELADVLVDPVTALENETPPEPASWARSCPARAGDAAANACGATARQVMALETSVMKRRRLVLTLFLSAADAPTAKLAAEPKRIYEARNPLQ